MTPPNRMPNGRRLGPRRGGALLLVLFATVALGAVAAAAVALTQSTNLVSAYQERERDFRYAAEMGLAMGRTRVERDTSFVLPDSGWRKVLDSAAVTDADGVTIPRTRVTVYAGKSGITTGQFGQFVTLAAVADDGNSTRYVRRLELAAENFARFAMFTNTWSPANLCYTTGETIRGLAWSNQDWRSCGAPAYWDTVGAVGVVGTVSSATPGSPNYLKGAGSALSGQRAIPMPTVSRLSFMPAYAAAGNLSFTPVANRPMRLEFESVDVDQNGDSSGVGEGFVRVFEAWSDDATAGTRLKLPMWSSASTFAQLQANVPWMYEMCGDFHNGKFYPAIVHKTRWFRDSVPAATDTGRIFNTASTRRNNVGVLTYRGQAANDSRNPDNLAVTPSLWEHNAVFSNPGARCYPAGSPQLAAVERVPGRPTGRGSTTWTEADTYKGGDDTTFTPTGRWGAWKPWTGSTALATKMFTAPLNKRRAEAAWLFPLGKQWNAGWRGIVHVGGDALLSGTVRARLTVYSTGAITFLDDLVYVTPPNTPGQACDAEQTNILGIIAVGNAMVDSNALHRPVRVIGNDAGNASIPNPIRFMSGGTPHFRLHAVVMSLTGTVGVNGYASGPSIAASACSTTTGSASFSGGCINQVGGVIEQSVSASTAGSGTGFAENREVDRCMLESSPPYFPTTGRFIMNRYFESDPARFNADALYRTLQAY